MTFRLVQRPEPQKGRFFSDKKLHDKVTDAGKALAARAHPRYAFLDAGTDVGERAAITALADALRAKADDLLVLGIGGSALGTTAFVNASVAPRRARVHVLESPDPIAISAKLAALDPRRTAVNVVSKSGTTIETLSQWAVIEAWLKGADDHYTDRVVMTTDPQSGPLRQLVNARKFQSLPVPEMVGGRYSVFTPVGLLPIAFAGVALDEIARGVAKAAEQGLGDDGLAATLARTLVQAHLDEQRGIVVVWPYGELLQPLGRWFQQLWAESLGKAAHSDGSVAHTGSAPLACVGPNDQHSLLQLFADGPKDKHFLFISAERLGQRVVVEDPIAGLDFVAGRDLGEILRAEARATFAALASQGHPCTFIDLPDLTAATLAELLVELMAATVMAARLYDVDPFDQPAVELGKRIALGLLGHAAHAVEAQAMARFLP